MRRRPKIVHLQDGRHGPEEDALVARIAHRLGDVEIEVIGPAEASRYGAVERPAVGWSHRFFDEPAPLREGEEAAAGRLRRQVGGL